MTRTVDIPAVVVIAACTAIACGDASEGDEGDSVGVGTGGAATMASGTGGGFGSSDLTGVGGGVGGTEPEASGGTGPLPSESVYSAPCGAPGQECGEGLDCVAFSLGGEGSRGYACTGTCPNGVEDCAVPPSGSSAAIGCWQFTTADRCVLVCEYNGQYFDCPAGMSCIRSADGRVGQCIWAT